MRRDVIPFVGGGVGNVFAFATAVAIAAPWIGERVRLAFENE